MDFSHEDKITYHLDVNNSLERVTELVQSRLLECGWQDSVRLACRDVIAESGDRVPTVDELINSVTTKAREMVPDPVKQELLQKLQDILVKVDEAGHQRN